MANLVKDFYYKLYQKTNSTPGITATNDIEVKGRSLSDSMVYGMDLMQLMGFDEEYKQASPLLTENVIYAEGDVTLFEATTKALGGLLGEFEMGGRKDDTILRLAEGLGSRLLLA